MITRTTEIPEPDRVTRTSQLPDPHEGVNANQYSQAIGPQRPDPHEGVNPNQYSQPAGPEHPHDDVDPDMYPTPASPNAADWDAQQRKVERHKEFRADRASEKARRVSAQEKENNSEGNKQFEADQERWNLQQKLKRKTEEYEDEQKKNAKPLKPITGKNVADRVKGVASKGLSAFGSQLKQDVGEFVSRKPRTAKPLTQAELAKALRESKGKQTKGQYHSPTYRGFPGGSNKPGGDPFAGMGMPGGGGRHASALPGGGSNAIRMDPFAGLGGIGRSQAPARQNVGKIQAAPRRPAPSPKPPRMQFPDPFAGLKSAGGSRMPKFDAQKDVAKGIGGAARSLGLGTGKKSAKKLRNVSDWMNF